MTEPTPPTGDGDPRPGARLGLILAAATVVWLAVKLWAAYRQIAEAGGGSVALASAALALPAVLQSTLLAGVGCGYAARHPGRLPRFAAAPTGGLLIGLAAMAAILVGYGGAGSTVRLGVTAAVAGLLGGVLAALPRPTAIIGAGLAAALGAFVLDTVLNSDSVLGGMMSAFGGRASATPERIVDASGTVAHIDSVVVGAAAGLLAYWYLRRHTRLRFPAYQLAGALTGIVLLAAELLAATGGADLRDAAAAISPADRTALDLLESARAINGLLVLFIGALVAMVAFGRTLGPRVAPDPEPVETPAQRSS